MKKEYRIKKVTNGFGESTYYPQERSVKGRFMPENFFEWIIFLIFPLYLIIYFEMRTWKGVTEEKNCYWGNYYIEIEFNIRERAEAYILGRIRTDKDKNEALYLRKKEKNLKKQKEVEYIKFP